MNKPTAVGVIAAWLEDDDDKALGKGYSSAKWACADAHMLVRFLKEHDYEIVASAP